MRWYYGLLIAEAVIFVGCFANVLAALATQSPGDPEDLPDGALFAATLGATLALPVITLAQVPCLLAVAPRGRKEDPSLHTLLAFALMAVANVALSAVLGFARSR